MQREDIAAPTSFPLTRAQFLRLAMGAVASAGLAAPFATSSRIGARSAMAAEVTAVLGSADVPHRTRILLATDLHYLAPSLIEAGKLADVGVISSGTMVTRYTDAIADAMVAHVISARPDAFVMTGDLTYNGERASHEEFTPKLAAIADAGIPVLVIPGNHDIHETSVRLNGAAENDHFTAADWFALYRRFGPDAPGTLACDGESFSFVWKANPYLRLFFVDCNAVPEMWTVPDSTLAWVESQLAGARDDGARVIAFSHQNVLGTGGYNGLRIANGDELEALFEQYGVIGNFSGHMHGQSILMRDSGLFDIVTSALSIWPLRMAAIDVLTSEEASDTEKDGDPYVGGRIDYATFDLDVSSWARDSGSTNPDLLDFDAFGKQFIYNAQYSTMLMMLQDLDAPTETAEELSDWFATVSVAYAEGTAGELEPRPDLLERFLEAAGDTTATRFAYGFDPTLMRVPDAFEAGL